MADWGYSREEHTMDALKGKYRCVIVDVEEGVTGPNSKAPGTPMITVTVRPSGTTFKVKYRIVKNDYFNRNMTSLFDSFQELEDGNFNFVEWIGCEGAAEFGEDSRGYTELKWFISPEKAADLPPFEGTKPERQTVSKLEEDSGDDDLPWV